MARDPRMFYGESESQLVEITSRTQHGRYLLRPSKKTNSIILGVLGRAQRLYNVYLHAFIVMSNHFHLLMSVLGAKQMSGFTGYFKGNVAKELGRIYDWRETLWGRRYHHAEVIDEEIQVQRFLYLLENGCKENLVFSPLDWPGVSSASALYRGETTMQGIWYDRTAQYRASLRGEYKEFPTIETVHLSPMPFLQDSSPEERHQWVVEEIDRIRDETIQRHKEEGTKPLGVDAIQRQDPHAKPKELKSSPAPKFHVANPEVYRALQEVRKAKIEAYRDAAARLKRGETDVDFPEGCFPPPLPYVESRAPP